MSDLFSKPAAKPVSNVPEFSVTELSFELKRTVEGAFSHVRVRGEISGFKRAASGHMYMALKDADAVMDAICWKGNASRLAVQPEDGLEVVATGKLTTYPGRSKYQIVIETMEMAGEGALLKLLEERKKKLAAEGLFDPDRKKEIPYLPEVIGIVTSPTGAVIRDILHRLQDRFPRHVLLWPVVVQGDGAAEKIAAAIDGFNQVREGGDVPRPDLLIVARGGGSLEDLWSFNEEVVVRATAASDIPVISAVGHETDTTLIDFASDRRAPTPTGAAEMAVPVRVDLLATVKDFERRLLSAQSRSLDMKTRHLEGLSRGLPKPDALLQNVTQRLDDVADKLDIGWRSRLQISQHKLDQLSGRLRSPAQLLDSKADKLSSMNQRLIQATKALQSRKSDRFEAMRLGDRLDQSFERLQEKQKSRLDQLAIRLENLSHKKVLERGFAVIQRPDGSLLSSVKAVEAGETVQVQFADGHADAVLGVGSFTQAMEAVRQPDVKKRKKKEKPVEAIEEIETSKKAKKKDTTDDRQDSLF
ncbi:exodeoxyribonuclease VII large subunit [Curvivirga aplysinae]|uniref:exodeoxyribonuclease VII large subunit n=1 Tax=Curvivirga aplysinae TaxID=2529852 RepID=UPI0012BD5098|nr:exodeoxyribonuclease VII large subunit [Curvivirga aplysinae]MTI09067.1 exodeoxyribonuclease VII large subunit [Curvivirga aplysinae]